MTKLTEKEIFKYLGTKWRCDPDTVRGFYKLYEILVEIEDITAANTYGVRQGRVVLPIFKKLMSRKQKLRTALGLCDIAHFQERQELTAMKSNLAE